MRILSIERDSITDGEGLRTVIFFSGCPHKCEGCHNPESWNYNNGKVFSLEEVLTEIKTNKMNDVTFSGGEPFFQAEALLPLAETLKARDKNIWCYTGYQLEWILKFGNENQKRLLFYIDVLVDGPYKDHLRDITLDFRGSSNQRILYLNKKTDYKAESKSGR